MRKSKYTIISSGGIPEYGGPRHGHRSNINRPAKRHDERQDRYDNSGRYGNHHYDRNHSHSFGSKRDNSYYRDDRNDRTRKDNEHSKFANERDRKGNRHNYYDYDYDYDYDYGYDYDYDYDSDSDYDYDHDFDFDYD